MPKSIKCSPRAAQLVSRFEARVEDYAFLGSAHPDEHRAIEAGYARAKRALLAYLAELERRPRTLASKLEDNQNEL